MSESLPLISICIPAYNAADFIEETIKGWQNQSYTHLEIIVQDDYSVDDTYAIALRLAQDDARIRVFRNSENFGIGKNWNEAYRKVKGEYVVIFNADDLINHSFLEHAVSVFKYQEVDLVSFKFTHKDTIEGVEWAHQPQNQLAEGIVNDLLEKVFFEMPFSWDFTLVKNSVFKALELSAGTLFRETQICDAELWYRVALANYKVYYNPYPAGYYLKHTNNHSKVLFAEDQSFIEEVLPYYHSVFKNKMQNAYTRFLRVKTYHLIKKSIKNLNFKGFWLSFKILLITLKK